MVLQGKYEIENGIRYEFDPQSTPIGCGGMGVVYKGVMINENSNMIREVAIKEIRVEADDKFKDEIIQKARREASIKIHNDNLVEMLSFIEEREEKFHIVRIKFYVISEFLHGVSLEDVLQGKFCDYKGDEISFARELFNKLKSDRENTAALIIKSILYGLTALNDNGYIHRDIDPSNIFVTEDGKIKLIDLGIAKKASSLNSNDDQRMNGTFVGKVEYAAPELINGDVSSQNFTTDIYSVGVVFYRLLTGRLPFSGDRYHIIHGHLKKKPNLKLIDNPKYRKIIAKAMEKKQCNRFISSSEMRVEFDRIVPEPKPKFLPIIFGFCLLISLGLITYTIIKLPSVDSVDSIDSIDPIDPIDPPQVIDLRLSDYETLSIDEIWNVLEKDSHHPIALYLVAAYYENRKDDGRASQFWQKQLIPEGDVNEHIKVKSKRNFSSLRFAFVAAARAMDNVSSYHCEKSFIEELDNFLNKLYNQNQAYYRK